MKQFQLFRQYEGEVIFVMKITAKSEANAIRIGKQKGVLAPIIKEIQK